MKTIDELAAAVKKLNDEAFTLREQFAQQERALKSFKAYCHAWHAKDPAPPKFAELFETMFGEPL